MARIFGIDLSDQQRMYMALRGLYGIGPKLSEEVLQRANVDRLKRARDLTSDEINRLQRIIEEYPVEGTLRRKITENIDRLKRNGSYRGKRHIAKLPVRGQRTKTNGRSARLGKRKQTVGAISKEMSQKIDAAKSSK